MSLFVYEIFINKYFSIKKLNLPEFQFYITFCIQMRDMSPEKSEFADTFQITDALI